ncbi:MAG: hypothetical protein Q9165_006221 [Trypethelium subeluteriae]
MSQFRAKKLDLGCFINARVIRDHTKRKVFEQFEPQRVSRIKNRCIMGGKGRGVLRDFRMARYQFRLNALEGNIPGVKKASW